MSTSYRLILVDDNNIGVGAGMNPTGFKGPIDSPVIYRKAASYLGALAQGAAASNLNLAFNPIAAQATVTFTGAGTNNDTLTIGPVTITLKTSGATGDQINIGASATATAANLVAFINAGGNAGDLSGICTASAVAGVVTLVAVVPGTVGNGLILSKSSTSITLTNLWGASVAGSEGTQQIFSLGK